MLWKFTMVAIKKIFLYKCCYKLNNNPIHKLSLKDVHVHSQNDLKHNIQHLIGTLSTIQIINKLRHAHPYYLYTYK